MPFDQRQKPSEVLPGDLKLRDLRNPLDTDGLGRKWPPTTGFLVMASHYPQWLDPLFSFCVRSAHDSDITASIVWYFTTFGSTEILRHHLTISQECFGFKQIAGYCGNCSWLGESLLAMSWHWTRARCFGKITSATFSVFLTSPSFYFDPLVLF